jgi:hypothetical protein
MFFSNFPRRNYIIDGASIETADIFRRVHPISKFVDSTLLEFYELKDGERPEHVSFELYQNVEFYWTILLINDVIDPYHDWLMSAEDLRNFVIQKYGSQSRLNDPHHYVYADTSIRVDYDHTRVTGGQIVPITNYDHEIAENEKKRNIYVLSQNHVDEFAAQFRTLIRE